MAKIVNYTQVVYFEHLTEHVLHRPSLGLYSEKVNYTVKKGVSEAILIEWLHSRFLFFILRLEKATSGPFNVV